MATASPSPGGTGTGTGPSAAPLAAATEVGNGHVDATLQGVAVVRKVLDPTAELREIHEFCPALSFRTQPKPLHMETSAMDPYVKN